MADTFEDAFWNWDSLVGVPGVGAAHHQFRDQVRLFVDSEILPHIDDWEEQGATQHPVAPNGRDDPHSTRVLTHHRR